MAQRDGYGNREFGRAHAEHGFSKWEPAEAEAAGKQFSVSSKYGTVRTEVANHAAAVKLSKQLQAAGDFSACVGHEV